MKYPQKVTGRSFYQKLQTEKHQNLDFGQTRHYKSAIFHTAAFPGVTEAYFTVAPPFLADVPVVFSTQKYQSEATSLKSLVLDYHVICQPKETDIVLHELSESSLRRDNISE